MHDPCTRSRCLKERTTQKHLQGAPVLSRPNTLRRLSQKCFYNSRVLERSQLRVPFVRMLGPFYSSEVLPPFLVEQASSLQSKLSETWWASLGLRSVRGPHKGQALPSLGLWTWTCGHGPIGLAKPYLIFYPLHIVSITVSVFCFTVSKI